MAKQNNSDWMSEYQDKELERIEKDISSLYSNAAKEVEAEFAKFTESSEKQMVAMQGKLEAGEISKSEYQVWVQKQMLQTDRYKATVKSMTDILVKSDKAAMAVMNGKLPTVVAESYNFSQALGFEAAKKAGLSVGTFQVYNAKSVQKIIKENPKLLKEVDVPEDKKWNQTKINREITTGMLKGESIPKVSERLRRVTDMDKNAATRNARTAMTAAENVGRSESAEELKEMGIPVEEVWSATFDKRTRETHILLDGTVKDENGFFGEGILLHPLRYPADPDGDPEEIYNCRCRLNIQIKGIDHSKDKDLYERFMKENDPDSYKRIREVDEPKEEAYQKNKEKAEKNLPARQERIRELKAQEHTRKEPAMTIPAHPTRPRMKDYMDENGFVDYDKYEPARAKYDKQMEEYNKIRDDYVKKYEDIPSMSMPELTKWCDAHNVEVLPSGLQTFIGGTADVSGIDGRVLTRLTERYDELFKKFPYVLDYRQDFMESRGESGIFRFGIGYAPKEQFEAEAGNGIVFGGGADNIVSMARNHFDMVSGNGLVNGSGSLDSLFDHEFGHNVEEAIIQKNGLSRWDFERECGSRLKGLEGASEYSTVKDTERFAEAFAAYIGGEDTPFAREMGKILKEQGMI